MRHSQCWGKYFIRETCEKVLKILSTEVCIQVNNNKGVKRLKKKRLEELDGSLLTFEIELNKESKD